MLQNISGEIFDRISEFAMQCDRRQSEIFTLAMQLADAAATSGDDPAVTARLDAKLPDYIDADLYAQLMEMKSGEKREAYLADLASRLPPNAVASARNRLDEAIAYAEKLFQEEKVISKEDFENRDVQKALLSREINAVNPIKPVGKFQLPPDNSVEPKKCIVRVAKNQRSSIFMRDMYGKVNKRDWFK